MCGKKEEETKTKKERTQSHSRKQLLCHNYAETTFTTIVCIPSPPWSLLIQNAESNWRDNQLTRQSHLAPYHLTYKNKPCCEKYSDVLTTICTNHLPRHNHLQPVILSCCTPTPRHTCPYILPLIDGPFGLLGRCRGAQP